MPLSMNQLKLKRPGKSFKYAILCHCSLWDFYSIHGKPSHESQLIHKVLSQNKIRRHARSGLRSAAQVGTQYSRLIMVDCMHNWESNRGKMRSRIWSQEREHFQVWIKRQEVQCCCQLVGWVRCISINYHTYVTAQAPQPHDCTTCI